MWPFTKRKKEKKASFTTVDEKFEDEVEYSNHELIEESKRGEGLTLSQSIAKGLKYKNQIVTKHEISSWLGHTYGDKVERFERGLSTAPSSKNHMSLPLADTHYAIDEKGNKVCFAFVYELELTHSVFLLLKMNENALKDVRTIYPNIDLSAFPKSYKEKWYVVFVDDTFKNKLDLYTLIGYAFKHIFEEQAISLKDSIALAYESAGFAITKREIADWLKKEYPEVEVNCRDLYAQASSRNKVALPLPDTHYRIKNKKRVCFAYVYQLENGNVFMLLRLNPKAYEEINKYCKEIILSAFPKTNDDAKWYTAIIDTSFIDKKQVYHLIEYAYLHVFED